ncbi:sulfite reductase subunit beta [Laetiporus sulphureus 93-53]|uniref:assimilatory sulfite reductase (NADPH) n=1 Tax=Laetiporus sulphureus 93-53 TaxID=1314785 RepID=A0A165G7A4_9APHY|nr:sulfite reductase subunit beta [Laetiporus sulphureus 93-53]KZT09927.1 sulfite reductase subunit beta [Laetiporus sulphureus 93-53]
MPASPSVRAVSRIAFLASDTLLASDSQDVAAALAALPAIKPTSSVQRLPSAADPGAALLHVHAQSQGVVSFLTISNGRNLRQLVPHLAELAHTPTVLHVAIPPADDLSDALVLRATVPICLYSSTAQRAHDHALLASRLARTEGRTVLHIFHVGTEDDQLAEIDEGAVSPYLYSDKPSSPNTNGHSTTNGNGLLPSKPVDESAALIAAYESAAVSTVGLVRRPIRALSTHGAQDPTTVLVTLGPIASIDVPNTAFVDVTLLKPLPSASLANSIPASASRVLVCEHIRSWSAKWTPLYLETVSALQEDAREHKPVVQSVLLGDARGVSAEDVQKLIARAENAPSERLTLGATLDASSAAAVPIPHIPKHEASYTSLLHTLFGSRLEIANDPSLVPTLGAAATSPEFTLGRIRGELETLQHLEDDVRTLLGDSALPASLHALLTEWAVGRGKSKSKKVDAEKEKELGQNIARALEDWERESGGSLKGAAARVSAARNLFAEGAKEKSRWIIGSDAWAYDLGASGLHHAVASGLNVNILILDTMPYTRASQTPINKRKRDAGLYAMNHGDAYVASVALYSSYAQVLQALVEADRFAGPSVVLAYLPYEHEDTPALEILKETKRAVDAGHWPLYRWDPRKEGEDAFILDSDAIKNELRAFLDRQNHLSQLNGRVFMKALNAAVAAGQRPLANVKYSVFGMGDSHYWPRPEDRHFYNKAGRDLDVRLESLGAQRVVPSGLGDDQDADGPETGYKQWEPLIWKALGVDSVEVQEAEPEPITNEHIKVASQYLRGTIKEGLEDTTTGALAPSDTQLTKFHGIYQQDDRDIRDERIAQGVEPAYSFMIRVRMPGGVCKSDQWLLMDQIADEHGCGTFKITTRQTFQFHGVIKRHLKAAIQDINRALLDTLAACGDVNRNVIVSAIPSLSKLHTQVYEFAKSVSERLLPRTTAYHEIWLDKKLVAGDAVHDIEPLYGEFYLPRKFKVAVAVPPTNDVDLFANDVGFIAIVNDKGELEGFNVTIGGGMGVTHGNKKTYPRLGSVIGYCTPQQGVDVAEKIMLVQRDNGNREDRKNARLKYTIDRMGLDVFKAEVEKLLGYQLQPARPYAFNRNVDDYGWHTGEDGKHHFMCFIENGRIQDEPGRDFKTGLREIAKVHKGTFRTTANQHLMISDIATEDLPQIKELLAKYKLDNLSYSALRLSSSACVAFPTCGLAMAESERYFPLLVGKVEKICEENGLRNDSIVMRMTGCPNGCARPYIAEVAFVGKAPGTYSILLGGGYNGERLNKIYRETVTEPEILAILRPMIKRYALERREGEHFGDWVIRAGYIAPTTEGKAWYDRMGGEEQFRTEVAAAA